MQYLHSLAVGVFLFFSSVVAGTLGFFHLSQPPAILVTPASVVTTTVQPTNQTTSSQKIAQQNTAVAAPSKSGGSSSASQFLQTSSVPSATIYQSALTQNTEPGYSVIYPTIMGTASGTNGILFTIKGSNYDSTYSKVVNGHWSLVFIDPLAVGTYTAEVFDDNATDLLATGTLTVVGPVLSSPP